MKKDDKKIKTEEVKKGTAKPEDKKDGKKDEKNEKEHKAPCCGVCGG